MSPFSEKRALPRHYDLHDVIVLQISGKKRWRIFEPQAELPLESLPRLEYETNEDVRQYRLQHTGVSKDEARLAKELVIQPGDLLYLPRGFPHEALTESDAGVSCHLTIGIKPTTYLDLLTFAISGAAYSDSRLREQLPLGFSTSEDLQSEVVHSLHDVVKELATKLDTNKALTELMSLFHRTYRGALENQLLGRQASTEAIDTISLGTRIGIREGVVLGIDYNATPAQLCFGGNRLAIQSDHLEAFQFICGNKVLSPAMLPGRLTSEQKLDITRQLISESIAFIKEGDNELS